MRSSARITANGSLPTTGLAHSTAWPRPSASGWRTYTHDTPSGTTSRTMRSSSLELVFHLVVLIEVILDGALAATGDEDQFGDAGGDGLLGRVLDQRLVDDGQHLFGVGLSDGQKARAHTGHGENGFAQLLGHALYLFKGMTFSCVSAASAVRASCSVVRSSVTNSCSRRRCAS